MVSTRTAFYLRLLLLMACAAVLLVSSRARAEGPEINPFGCLGRYETATGDRSLAQMKLELERKQQPLFEKEDPHSIRALKACVVAMLKSRLGHADAGEWYERSIDENPKEPGYELFAGNYYSGFRGARAPVVELAEKHYYAALQKLEALEKAGKRRAYHDVVEEWVKKRLMVLYQQDGWQVLPWKAYWKHDLPNGLNAPGLALGGEYGISKDTRPFNRKGDNNEMRVFSGEADFANSDLRAGAAARPVLGAGLTDREVWDIARAPWREQGEARVRLRQRHFGALDFRYYESSAHEAQITSFYYPTQNLADVRVREAGLSYQRVLPLYPLLDFRILASASRGERTGAVEFLPLETEHYNLYEFSPSFSRFLGTDKLTLDLTYAKLDITDSTSGPTADRLREKVIRGVELEYALYSPLTLPRLGLGSLRPFRTATRGWYFFAGAVQDDEVYGARTVTKRDIYGGSQFRGPGRFDLSLQGTYVDSHTQFADPNDGHIYTDGTQTFSGFRTSAALETRLIDPDAIPGINGSIFAPDQLSLVIPVTHDLGLEGRTDYENVRAGAQLWFKFFGTGFWGPAFLISGGYDYQYFYNISKGMHLFQVNARLGWGEL